MSKILTISLNKTSLAWIFYALACFFAIILVTALNGWVGFLSILLGECALTAFIFLFQNA